MSLRASLALLLVTLAACGPNPTPDPTPQTFKVSATGAHLTVTPNGIVEVTEGGTQTFEVTAELGYTRLDAITGTCPGGSWDGAKYTTGPITADCGITFSAAVQTFLVTPGGDGHENISPTGPQTVAYGSTQAFVVDAETGYTVNSAVGGTCAAGAWSGTTYTTGVITGPCSVAFTATIQSFAVTPSGDTHVSFTPNTAQTVDYGDTLSFTVTANTAGYDVSTTVGGTCAAGTWTGTTYTTGAITSACTVSFTGTLQTFAVTPSGDGNVVITPNTPQQVAYGATKTFDLLAITGYDLNLTAGGTCPAGSWNGYAYTTGAITAACSVTFSATAQTFTVTASGDGNVTFTPSTPQTVSYGNTLSFTVTANANYNVLTTVSGTCVTGSWNGNVYTTAPISGDCTVMFNSAHQPVVVTPSGDGHVVITPDTPQSIPYATTKSFDVLALTGYDLNTNVGGTCGQGSWNGTTYTTPNVGASCTVTFSATVQTYTVTPGGDGNVTFTPSTPQPTNYGATQSFTVTANTGYNLLTVVSGSCQPGSWNGNVYTTGTTGGDCDVRFNASLKSYTITATGDGHETITPSGATTVSHGFTKSFTVVGDTSYDVSTTVGGTCPAGSWNGNVYTTSAITGGDCTVSFTARPVVAAQGDGHVSIAPSTVAVTQGQPASFVVTANANYVLSNTVGGTCPQGTWSGATYTTGPISAPCVASFSATLITYTVNVSGDGYETFTPSTPQTVVINQTQSYNVTFQPGKLQGPVAGDCPSGTWSGSTYTTGSLAGYALVGLNLNCDNQQAPIAGQSVNNAQACIDFCKATPNCNYAAFYNSNPNQGGFCNLTTLCGPNYKVPSGANRLYRMMSPGQSCTVNFTSRDGVLVSVIQNGNVVATPYQNQTAEPMSTLSYTVTDGTTGAPYPTTVGGTCPIGTWSGNVYTTGALNPWTNLGSGLNCDNTQQPIGGASVSGPNQTGACYQLCAANPSCAYFTLYGGASFCNLNSACNAPYSSNAGASSLNRIVRNPSCTVTFGP